MYIYIIYIYTVCETYMVLCQSINVYGCGTALVYFVLRVRVVHAESVLALAVPCALVQFCKDFFLVLDRLIF